MNAITRYVVRAEGETVMGLDPTAKYIRPGVYTAEQDPNGLAPSAPGAKLDAGKVRPELIIRGFARALLAVADVGTFGANKYSDNGWQHVPDGIKRYTDAMYRHLLKEHTGELCDKDTGLHHAAHAAWNALARLELMLRNEAGDSNGV